MGEWILPEVLQEVDELTWQNNPDDAWRHLLQSAVAIDRIELGVFSQGDMIGFCVLAEDDDIHVGRCLTVMWDYVVPSHRGGTVGQRMLRTAKSRAQQLGFSVLCYTHRTGLGVYQVRYIRLENKHG